MRSLKTCLVLGLAILLIGSFGCKDWNPFGPNDPNDEDDDKKEQEFAYDVNVGYERIGS